jgi:hypothetical protein
VGAAPLRRCGFREPFKQGCHGSDVLACPGEEWGALVVLEDLLIHVAGIGARTPTISATCDLLLELGVLLV